MDRYGDRDWKLGDIDTLHIKRLQRDLIKLGFGIVGKIDGYFGRQTFWAIREFQIHASWTHTGKLRSGSAPIHERLFTVSVGSRKYDGHIDGKANNKTRSLISSWLDNDWHCPIIVSAFRRTASGAKGALVKENVWLHNDYSVSTKQIVYYAFDVSGRFGELSMSNGGGVNLGRYVRYLTYGGQVNTPPDFTDINAEITPKTLTEKPFAKLSAAGKSTFRVIRAVSEVECFGFFDTLNAYDNAFVSLGPCHWTLGIVQKTSTGSQVSYGELCGTLSYFEHAFPLAAKAYIGNFGVSMTDPWLDAGGSPSGAMLFDSTQKKYTSWPAFPTKDGHYNPVPLVEADGNYFKSWHWIYRWIALGRSSMEFRKAIWTMSRVRLRDLMSIKVKISDKTYPLGQIFTSEMALALLLRWHIRYPALIAYGSAGKDLRRIVKDALSKPVNDGWQSNPKHWKDPHEARLIESILKVAKMRSKNFQETIKYVNKWPGWANGNNPREYRLNEGIHPLNASRNSFSLETSKLPPKPWQLSGDVVYG